LDWRTFALPSANLLGMAGSSDKWCAKLLSVYFSQVLSPPAQPTCVGSVDNPVRDSSLECAMLGCMFSSVSGAVFHDAAPGQTEHALSPSAVGGPILNLHRFLGIHARLAPRLPFLILQAGTKFWMPPEAYCYHLGPYSYDSDVFSVHVVMFEVMTISRNISKPEPRPPPNRPK